MTSKSPSRVLPRPRKAPAPLTGMQTALTPMETWYLDAVIALRRFHGRAASLAEIATWLVRSRNAVYAALCRMERKGRLVRDDNGHFEVV